MAHLSRTICLFSVGMMLSSAFGQKIVTGRKLLAGELHPAVVAAKAADFVRLLGHNPGELKNMLLTADPRRGSRDWLVYTGGHEHWIGLDAVGNVNFYAFQARRQDQFRNKGRTGKQFCQNAAQAKAHLYAVATKLGIPFGSVLKSFSWARDGEVADANSAGSFGGSFVDSHGKMLAAMSCDPQDGQLVFYVRYNSQVGPPRQPKR